MTDRKRSPLPEGYQFGDAAPTSYASLVDAVEGARVEIGETIYIKIGPPRFTLLNPSARVKVHGA